MKENQFLKSGVNSLHKEIFAFCVRRTGHTAILNWIAGHCTPVIWLNNIFMQEDLYRVPCIIECVEGKEAKVDKRIPLSVFSNIEMYHYKIHIYSFEDNITNPFTLEWMLETVKQLSTVKDPFVIFTLRSIYATNLSQKHFGKGLIPPHERTRSIEILRAQKRYCKDDKIPNLMCINFEEWCESESYRRSISKNLGLTFSDSRYKEILSNSSYRELK